MHILGFLFIIIIAILIIGLSVVGAFLRALFGFGRKFGSKRREDYIREQNDYQTEKKESSRRSKIFDKDEGEYVDYEEV